MSGWIKFYRQFKDNDHFHMPDRALKIWLYILLSVSHKDNPAWGLKAGEGWISYDMIAEDCSEGKGGRIRREAIARELRYLEEHGYIERSISPGKGQKIRVVNWDRYQADEISSSGSGSETEPVQMPMGSLFSRGSSETEPQAELVPELIQEYKDITTTNPPIVPPLTEQPSSVSELTASSDERWTLLAAHGSKGNVPEGASEEEREALRVLSRVKGYPLDYTTDLEHIRRLLIDYPSVDVFTEIRKWADYKLDKPLKAKSNPRLQLRNWMENAVKFQEQQRGRDGRYGDHRSRRTPGRLSTDRGTGKYASAFGR